MLGLVGATARRRLPECLCSALSKPLLAKLQAGSGSGQIASVLQDSSDPSPAPAAGDNASELPPPADATAGSSPPPGPKNPKKRGLRLWPGEKGAENIAASVSSTASTTTLLDPPLDGEEYDDDEDEDDSVEDAVLDPELEGAEDPTAELRRLAEENAELRRQLAASTKGGDA